MINVTNLFVSLVRPVFEHLLLLPFDTGHLEVKRHELSLREGKPKSISQADRQASNHSSYCFHTFGEARMLLNSSNFISKSLTVISIDSF